MTDLLDRTAELVDLPSTSRDEAALADLVESQLAPCGWLEVTRIGDNVVARTNAARHERLVFAGHLDTVPPNGNAGARRDGDTVWGCGASDMKGGLAVMLDLASTVADPAVDVTWCFYAREEIGRADSGLLELWTARPDLLAGDAAVLGEPTLGVVEAGCQGTMARTVELTGIRAHTARPFAGRNAIHRLAPVLAAVAGWESRRVVIDGCEYAEQLQAVRVSGGVAGNVVPDAASLTVNYRFAPDRSLAEAHGVLDELLSPYVEPESGDTMTVGDESAGAPPSLDHPLLARLVASTGEPPRAKVGWTDVASFWAHGVPAANFGPGDPLLAHHPEERVERAALERVRSVLAELIS